MGASMSDEYTGGTLYDISGKTLQKQVDAMLGVLDKWYAKNPDTTRCIVWLNPAMRPAGETLTRVTQRKHIEVRYSTSVKPATFCAIEGVA